MRRNTAIWKLQDAKARFSEVFRLARSSGPQTVTRHGKEAVVVIPAEDFDRLSRPAREPKSLVRFFRESPLAGSGIDLERKPDYGRPVDL
jgi:antitoxin Phd